MKARKVNTSLNFFLPFLYFVIFKTGFLCVMLAFLDLTL